MNPSQRLLLTTVIAAALAGCAATGMAPGKPELIVVGLDEKVTFSNGPLPGLVFNEPGKDTVAIIDIGTNPLAPKIVGTLPIMNSVIGPPVNLAISPDRKIALVANSLDWQKDGAAWKSVPDNKVSVVDLTANPPAVIQTLTVGKQPSGLSINRAGTLALVTNRADNTVSVLAISDKNVRVVDTVAMGNEQVTHAVFTPDGRRALVAKFPLHKVSLLAVDGEKVTYNKQDIPVGLWPYNVDVTPDGRLAIVANTGNSGRSDGQADSVSVIDLEADPPRVIDTVGVGDGAEGLAISPRGDFAVVPLLNGADAPKDAWYYNRNSKAVGLKIDGKKVTVTNYVDVHGLPEGLVFSEDGHYVYVGNYIDRDISILEVRDGRLVDTGKTFQLPGQPASMRARTR